jgi:hypothetical protein
MPLKTLNQSLKQLDATITRVRATETLAVKPQRTAK